MDDVIIVGSLDKKELEKSINELVEFVGKKTNKMAEDFTEGLDKMKLAMKEFAITQKVSVDLMQDAWKKMSASFDAMVAAQSSATSSVSKPTNSITETRNNISAIEAEIKKIEEERQKFISIREEIGTITGHLRASKKDLKLIESGHHNVYEFDDFGNKVFLTSEKVKNQIKGLTDELRKLWSERGKIPAPTKEDLQKYDELQRKLAELKKSLDKAMTPETVGDLEKQISTEERYRKKMELGTQELRNQNQLIAEQKQQLKEELMTEEEKRKAIEKQNEALERQKSKELKKQQSPYKEKWNIANTMSSKSLDDAERKLQALRSQQEKMKSSGLFDQVQLNKNQQAIDSLEQKIARLRDKKPKTLKEVLGMDESTIDAITKKMAALKKVTVDPQNTAQVKQLGDEYQRLKRLQAELMGQNIQMTHSNNYLAQSFGYIRNRLVYALTLGAITSFTKQVYEIRSQYELLERSLGVLVNSFQRGSQIFQELNDMALKSPFTLIELATAAKQLTAYNFTANEVVNTTRRLADISAALGVPMERLTYNLGQIRAQTVLTARDARDFANAGLPIVKSLADYYSVLEKRVVSTGDVYDRMSKKMVSYSDVMAVLNKMTDEGGKFFDFQAKQAETLRVQLNNLTLAWNNMLNEMGEENQGILNLPVKGLKVLLQNWKSLDNLIWDVISLLGTFKAMQVVYAMHANKIGFVNLQMKSMYLGGQKVIDVFKRIGAGIADAFKNKYNWITLAAVALMDLAWSAWEAHKAIKAFHEAMRENATESIGSIDKFSETYKELRNTLNTASKSDIAKKISVEDSQKAWKAMKEEINTSVSSSTSLIAKLENINDINNRLKTGFDYLDKVKAVDASIQSMKDGVISISQDWAKWWNAWLAPEGLTQNVRDYVNAVKEGATSTYAAWEQMVRDLKPTIEDIFTYAQTEGYDATQQREFFERVLKDISHQEKMSVDEYRTMRMQAEQEYAKFAVGSAKSEFEQRRALQETFFTWINERHSSELSSERIKELQQGTFLTGENAKWAKQRAQEFSKQYGTSFNDLWGFVQKANTWSIYIPVVFGDKQEQQKSFYDQLSEADKNANAAYSKIQRLQQRINELRAQGGDVSGISKELAQAQQDLKDAESAGGHASKQAKANAKAQKTAVQEVSEALKDEIRLINEMRSNYDKLRKAGVSNMDAIDLASRGYEATIIRINQVLSKFGIDKFNAANFAGKDVRSLLQTLEEQRQALLASGKVKTSSLQALDVEIQKLTVDAKTYDMKKVTDGLNSELGKIKDEYELAIELDANPELGDMFADMFGINTSTLPKTFGDALDRAQKIINRKLAELNITTPFDLIEGDIDSFAKSTGLDKDGSIIKELVSVQKSYRDMFKKNITETEKMLDDYVKKYGDYSDKIAEVEANRLEKLKKLNEAYYTDEMRQRPEYLAKLNAIEDGSKKEKSNIRFDDFKNSRYYTMMFENLDYVSTKAIRDMRERIRELIDTTNDLTPEQLKTFMSQYEKLEQKLVKRSPFKTLTKDLKEYFSTSKERKDANEAFRNAQKEYDAQKEIVATLKEKYEQAKANSNTSKSYLDFLQIEIDGESEVLKILKEQLELAQKKADKYNLTKKLVSEEAESTAQLIAQNLASLAELRDNLQQTFGFDFGDDINTAIDGLTRAGNGLNKTISSLQSGNVVGATSGVVDIIGGIGDSIASIFGDGSARTKRLNREINESKETVRQLSMAYNDLEMAIKKSLGTGETEARRLAIANKEAQLAELERQKELEQSKRSKDRDDDAIKQYEESIHSLRNEIEDLKEDVINNLWGEDVKSAAEAFVDAWVQAWRAGETTLDAIREKMDEMIYNLIKKAMTSKIVETLLRPVYDELDKMTKEGSEGGVALTTNELRMLAQQAGITAEQINVALGEFYGNLEQLGIVSKTKDESNKLSALQQGIQGVTEDTAGAIEAYMNIVAQRVFEQNLYLQEIRDHLNNFDLDVQLGTLSQMLLQLQQSYLVQQNIETILNGVLNPSGRAIVVELNS